MKPEGKPGEMVPGHLRSGPRGAPRAAIVIAAYNAEATLERALCSAFAQTVPVEVVVVDDASQDGTADLAERLCRGVPGATVLRQPRNAGPAAARNRAIETVTAPWVAVLDADDHMAPDRIARLADEAEAAGLDCLADDLYIVTEADPAATARRLWSPRDFERMRITLELFVDANAHGSRGLRGELGFIKPLMRRAFLQENALRYDEDLRLAEDYILYAQALAAGAAFRLVDPRGYFAVYRENSLSGCHSTEDLGALVQADRRLLRAPGLDRSARAAIRRHCRQAHKEWVWRRMIDAVRARDLRSMAALWLAPPAVSVALMGKLLEQVWLRGRRRLGLGRRSGAG